MPPPPDKWIVLVEESSGGYRGRRIDNSTLEHVYPSRDMARQAAFDIAQDHQPRHPSIVRQRTVIRRSPDEYTVLVEGLLETHHYEVSVGELVS
ncbi:MAG: hypothetical protein M0026_13930 [Nocardiopsaceae bacterium]|nr:hypothetical protein [Nocardiopsaceae bacterium]